MADAAPVPVPRAPPRPRAAGGQLPRTLTAATEPFDIAIQSQPSGSARRAFAAPDEVFPVAALGLLGRDYLPLPLADLPRFPYLFRRLVPQDWMDCPGWFSEVGRPVPRTARVVDFGGFPLVLQAAVAGQGIALA